MDAGSESVDAQRAMLYLAYGSNLNKAHMGRLCPLARPIGTAALANWRLVFRGVADIEPHSGDELHCGLWAVTPHCVAALDWYEGYPDLYRKIVLPLNWDGKSRQATIYRMVADHPPAPPREDYLTCIKEGYRDFGLPRVSLETCVARARQ